MTPLAAIPILPIVRTQPCAWDLAANRSDLASVVTLEDVTGWGAGLALRCRDADRPLTSSAARTELQMFGQTSHVHGKSNCPPISNTLRIGVPIECALKPSALIPHRTRIPARRSRTPLWRDGKRTPKGPVFTNPDSQSTSTIEPVGCQRPCPDQWRTSEPPNHSDSSRYPQKVDSNAPAPRRAGRAGPGWPWISAPMEIALRPTRARISGAG